MKVAQSIAVVLTIVSLIPTAGCGGKGSASTSTPAQAAPAITAQPASLTVQSGQTATFAVTATGSPSPSYQWMVNSSPIMGATASSYTTGALTTVNSGSIYDVEVTNAAGSVTSSNATLTVTPAQSAPTITAQPAGETVQSGQSATFTVTASGNPAPTYQWMVNGSPVPGATAATYTTPVLTTASSGSTYTVTITNSLGSVTSSAATLTVSNIASAILARSVVLLTTAQEAAITAVTASSVTFSQAVTFAPGTVVLGTSHVFKVVSTTISGSKTIVTVTDPLLTDLFTSLVVQGSYTATPGMAVQAVDRGPERQASRETPDASANGNYTFSWPFTISDGGFSLNSTLTSTISAFVNYNFQSGTLQRAELEITDNSQLTLTESFSAQSSASTEKELGTVTIPIPVSVADSTLASLGIYTLSLSIPAYAGVTLDSAFNASLTQTLTTTGAVNLTYDPGNGPAASSSFVANYTPNALSPTAPPGSPLATFTENGSVYVRIAPALAFFNTLALLGVDTRLSLDDDASLQLVTGTPPYCINNNFDLTASANGFFKAVGISPLKTSTYSSVLYTGTPQQAGTCQAASQVSAITPAAQPIAYRASVPIMVTVAPNPSDSPAPTAAPTGGITVLGGGSGCQATLMAAAKNTATATCNLSPLSAGTSVPVSVSYSGDKNFAPGTTELGLNIADSQYSLLGSPVTLVEDEPLNTPLTQAVTVRAGPGITFSSGNLVTLTNATIIGSTIQVGENYVDLSYTISGTGNISSFNGPVLTFGSGAPSILGCSLDPGSSGASQFGISCTQNQVLINGSGVAVTPNTKVLIDLQLGPPTQ